MSGPFISYQGVRLSFDELAFLDGLLEAFEDLPDGAWQSACEDAISSCDRFKGRDAYGVWLTWCMSKADA